MNPTIMERSAASQLYTEKISQHHANEVYARGCARTTISRLRKMQMRELAGDRPYLVGLSQIYKIDYSHVELFVEMVEELINADRIPRRYQRELNRVPEQQQEVVPNPGKWLSLEQQRMQGVKA